MMENDLQQMDLKLGPAPGPDQLDLARTRSLCPPPVESLFPEAAVWLVLLENL